MGQQVSDVDWMQERGVLGPVVARLLMDADFRQPLLLALRQPS